MSELRVLVVDDNADNADSLAAMIRQWGHLARAVYTGSFSLKIAVDFLPQMFLLDLAMPHMDGCNLARQLRQRPEFARARIVAMSGYGDDAHQKLAADAGFDAFLVKPVEPDALQALVNALRRD